MALASVLIGVLLLFFGRDLFWLFVAGAGFILGFNYGPLIFPVKAPFVILMIAMIAGVIGVILALLLRDVAIAVGGFVAGGYAFVEFINSLDVPVGLDPWVLFILGGIIGVVILFLIFEPALIFLSAFLGASTIVQFLILGHPMKLFVFLILIAFGIAFQTRRPRRRRRI